MLSVPLLDPPAAALTETEESLGRLLGNGGGLLVTLDGEDVGALVLDPVGTTMYLRRFGVSPRGAQTLALAARAQAVLSGRSHVGWADLRAVLLPALRHRFQLNFEGVADGISKDELLLELLEAERTADSAQPGSAR